MNQFKLLFSTFRKREEILAEIEANPKLYAQFNKMLRTDRERFLDLCCGAKGLKILSDPFFKEIMNPEYTPGRLESFLSCILNQNITILQVLPNDSVRIASEATLLITDIVVELEDRSIVNIEIQRIGYMFPGERAACYSADMLLRQYKRVRESRGKKFVYKDVKPVYTIVLFEKSPSEFHIFPDNYVHYIEPRSNTGIELNLLQKFIFVSLDIFKKKSHNKVIKDELDAWLTFFSSDRPEQIEQLLDNYPYFTSLYNDIYNLCMNTERMMEMFSKELQMLDENTTQYMMDELQERLDEQKQAYAEQKLAYDEQTRAFDEQTRAFDEQTRAFDEQTRAFDEQTRAFDEQTRAFDEQKKRMDEQQKIIDEKDQLILQLQQQLQNQ